MIAGSTAVVTPLATQPLCPVESPSMGASRLPLPQLMPMPVPPSTQELLQ